MALNISLHALIRVLTHNKLKFSVSECNGWDDNKIIRFTVEKQDEKIVFGSYFYMSSREDADLMMSDKMVVPIRKRIILHYDITDQKVLGTYEYIRTLLM